MTRSDTVLAAAAVALLLGLGPASAQTSHDHAGASSASSDAYMKSHHAMMEAMDAAKPSGDPDKDFVTMMIPHHQGAVDMAEVELKYGKDPALKALAQKIIDDQKREIAEMQAWLAANK